MNELPTQNTGLLLDFSPSIWLAGDIPYEIILESGNWLEHNVVAERQKGDFDTKGCVTYSLCNNIEIQHKFKGINLNLSDRFTAKASDTQQNGNTFERVADSMRNIGVVKESDYPNDPFAPNWNTYYQTIPQTVMQKAVKVDMNYAIIPRSTDWANQLRKYLKQSPLWITWPASPYHAMTLMNVRSDNIYADVKDHYQDIKKIKISDIAIAAVVKLNKLINMNDNFVIYKDGSEYQLALKAKSEEGFAQQLFSAGATHLLTSDGKPNFVEIDKIAKIQ